LAEAITDPDGKTGWRDRDKPSATYHDEIGDIVQDTVPPGDADGYILDGYAVQKEWSNTFGVPWIKFANFLVVGGTIDPFKAVGAPTWLRPGKSLPRPVLQTGDGETAPRAAEGSHHAISQAVPDRRPPGRHAPRGL
jgi:hypothetical protein